ncbi:hypothetical protein Poly24_13580 [Rosistilla carotiformis]|uniref:Lipoprotein n=1 Tax=Rosistilla carotiformis TaxID=2528017 RepID=A0A518JQ32_9BACT|nr:hypothetical protein [Rosistilla carotiformis]QDV67657.1 hypothetical protein Poly24_13580 [Rosistilla carotiformis]
MALRRSAYRLLLSLGFSALLLGCGTESKPPVPSPVVSESSEPAEDSRVELQGPKAWFEEPNICYFEVQYQFVAGKPSHSYRVEVSFPGSENAGAKEMASWELKASGTIRDGIVVHSMPIREVTVKMTEAFSPQAGYHAISNEATATIDKLPESSAETESETSESD